MNEKRIEVLGTIYTIKESCRDEDPVLEGCDGYVDDSVKEIVIDKMLYSQGKKKDMESYRAKVIRHELIHAFASESGLEGESFAANEEMVDWVANQFPKFLKAFQEAEAI